MFNTCIPPTLRAVAAGAVPASAAVDVHQPTTLTRPQIWLLGDSLTQQAAAPEGWATALCSWYARKADVVNRGFSGYNSRWLRLALPKVRAHARWLAQRVERWRRCRVRTLPHLRCNMHAQHSTAILC